MGPLKILAAISVALISSIACADAAGPEVSPSRTAATAPKWEDEILNGYLPYHQLTADDFVVRDDLDPQVGYYVQAFTHYYYSTLSKMAESGIIYAYLKDWTVYSGFNKNLSGRRSKLRGMKEELPYAQAILDLNEIYARKLAALQPTDFPSASGVTWPEVQRQLEERVQKLCAMQMGEMRKEADTLAKATKNGQNKKRVHELAAAIKKRLDQLPPATTPSPLASPYQTGAPLYIPPPATIAPSPRH